MVEETFDAGERVRDVVRLPVRAEQEGGRGRCGGGVTERGGVVFEEVEEGEEGEEEGEAPQWGAPQGEVEGEG